MTNEEYFYSLLPKEEIDRLPYLPTMGQFVDWFTKEYADNPAISDMTNTITYKELGERVGRRAPTSPSSTATARMPSSSSWRSLRPAMSR